MTPNKFYSTILVLIQLITSTIIFLTGSIWVVGVILKVLFLAGILFAIWAILTIRLKNLQISPEIKHGSSLVKSGPYRFIRHPMYASLLMITLILIINDFSPLRFFLWILLAADILLKLSYEEKLLLIHFEDYANYRKQTNALIPKIF